MELILSSWLKLVFFHRKPQDCGGVPTFLPLRLRLRTLSGLTKGIPTKWHTMSDGVEDRSGEQLTPKEAYNLTENQGMKGKTVGKMFDISGARVSQLKNQYEEGLNDGRKEGRNSVEPSDFGREELENALSDKKEDDDIYECPTCEKEMDYMEYDECPNCGTNLGWSQL